MSLTLDQANVLNITLSVLDDDEGVSQRAYDELIKSLSFVFCDEIVSAIADVVDATDGRFYFKSGVKPQDLRERVIELISAENSSLYYLKRALYQLPDNRCWELILKVMLRASLEVDNSGQYVVYTDVYNPNYESEEEDSEEEDSEEED